jgi:peptidoglycan/LPS O-acetylase OafA/YrhL
VGTRGLSARLDGLRALAVLAIFAFHLGLAGSRGGFVGVDVFFVISGFVITRGVLLKIDEQRFSYKLSTCVVRAASYRR